MLHYLIARFLVQIGKMLHRMKGKSKSLPGGPMKTVIFQDPGSRQCLSLAQAKIDQASQQLSSLNISFDDTSEEIRAPKPYSRIPSCVLMPDHRVESESSTSQFRFGYANRQQTNQDWICVPTKKHPEIDKPLHRGRITSFRNLFENSFQSHVLYDPNSRGYIQKAYSGIKMVEFNGYNIEIFPEFEQYMLMKVINNETLDFDGKFHMLLSATSDAPQGVVHVYTDTLNLANFVQAIEDLYYYYGEPSKFRDTLLSRFLNQAPIDINNPESLLHTSSMISRIFRAFRGTEEGDVLLSMSLFVNSIKMTPETALSYVNWRAARMAKNTLRSLQEWLDVEHSLSVSDNFEKSAHAIGSTKLQPLLINSVSSSELPEPYTKSMDYRCLVCFAHHHDFADCSIYLKMTPDQRVLTLHKYEACYKCTALRPKPRIGSDGCCTCQMSCQVCQSPHHHFTICKMSGNPWKAVLSQ